MVSFLDLFKNLSIGLCWRLLLGILISALPLSAQDAKHPSSTAGSDTGKNKSLSGKDAYLEEASAESRIQIQLNHIHFMTPTLSPSGDKGAKLEIELTAPASDCMLFRISTNYPELVKFPNVIMMQGEITKLIQPPQIDWNQVPSKLAIVVTVYEVDKPEDKLTTTLTLMPATDGDESTP